MERYYTISEVSEATHIPRRTCYDAVASGLLKVVTPNGGTRGKRTTEAWVSAWLEGERAAGQERPPERGPKRG